MRAISGKLTINTLAVLLLTSLLAACSSAPDKTVRRPTLAELAAFDKAALAEPQRVTAAQLQQVYQDLLALAPAAAVRQKVLYRLSQLNTRQLELSELEPAAEQQALLTLIAEYRALLAQFPADPNNELIHYQLARALDLTGNSQAAQQQMQLLLKQYPQSEFAAELWFRIGDIYYSQGSYAEALTAFAQVLALAGPELTQHALYMSGWSHFQLQHYAAADDAFLQALDLTYHQRLAADEQQSLRQELQRILSISLSYQQQAASLLALLKRAPFRDGPAEQRPVAYQAALYQALADFLFEKELNQAALDSYRVFIADQPLAIEAARMQLQLVQYHLDYAEADAAEQAQQSFINRFGPASAFWQQARPNEQAELAPRLAQYLDYFGRNKHQQALQASAAAKPQQFASLVSYWQQLLQVHPLLAAEQGDDSLLWPDDIRYLLAEALAESGEREAALAAYQQLGYPTTELDAQSFTAEQAAYRALLLSEALAKAAPADPAAADIWWQQQQQFVRWHSRHPAAQQVALNQLTDIYQQQAYSSVAEYARRVTDWPHPELSNRQLVNEALFIVSQTELAQDDYTSAEQSITQLLKVYAAEASATAASSVVAQRYQLLTEQLASAVYQQAQQPGITITQQLQHIERLLQLPVSEYHQSAAYQQISLLLEQQALPEAISLMQAYQQRYPNSAELPAISKAMLNSYEQLQDWQSAADLLSQQVAALTSGTEQQALLYKAAGYYWQAGNSEAARLAYRSYANQYPEPHIQAQEARARLVQLYQAQNDTSRQNFWYQRIVNAEQQYANKEGSGNERSRYLAAEAALQLGLHNSALFSGVSLRQPLRDNLKKKQGHMTAAIKLLQTSMSWQVADFYSQAQYQIGELYQQMAAALLNSERPKGLDAMALEQYDLLLEEQAYPFEELAIEIYQQNTALVSQPLYDKWIAASFSKLAELSPARYRKPAVYLELADEAY
ncbi:tetratricopeptide repeat protein [Arsukibacterium indicum]|uniref:Tetratricopeptide repeat protein n=1 Tax=Arsukibacterium indicum TaxID=2848612 RepID=A0ABS6MHM4_9GAMM|nr:tetratricopeptide repeat protein [Arsukibacterium indicum]MBV2128316.1 tetratricopeptide repeat protein [Arsukibacterium indicum]